MENSLVRFGVRSLAASRLLPAMEKIDARRRNCLRVLLYHRIAEPWENADCLDPSLISATPQQFEEQMQFVRKHYQVLSIIDVLLTLAARQPFQSNALLVTFDDGYHDFWDTAWPILKKMDIPALMFLPTAFMESNRTLFWWDQLYQAIFKTKKNHLNLPGRTDISLADKAQRWRVFNQLKEQISMIEHRRGMQLVNCILQQLEIEPETCDFLLSWPEARSLHQQGCCLAGHTRDHAILSHLPVEAARRQITDAQQDIRREIGETLPVTAYPSGHTSDCGCLNSLMHEEGFQIVMSSIPGINIFPQADLLKIKRIGLSPRINLPEFRLILTSMYHAYCSIQASLFKKA